jgi:hypothetical protein
MKKVFFLLLSSAMVLASCEKDKNNDNVFKGPVVQVHGGKAWTWVKLDSQDRPESIGISLDDKALNSVPGPDGSGHMEHDESNNFVLKFHPKADATPFKHVWLNWNPNGHPPVGVYNKPHFDVHFYTVTSAERETFVDTAKLNKNIAASGYIPANHLGVDPLPQMGHHYVDLASPELAGQPFTQTFIFGSYDTKPVFWEPMITLEFLKNTTNFERPIPQPAKYDKTGYYPTKMRVTKQNGVTNVIFEGFVLRQAS